MISVFLGLLVVATGAYIVFRIFVKGILWVLGKESDKDYRNAVTRQKQSNMISTARLREREAREDGLVARHNQRVEPFSHFFNQNPQIEAILEDD